jgi:hypothetical protein
VSRVPITPAQIAAADYAATVMRKMQASHPEFAIHDFIQDIMVQSMMNAFESGAYWHARASIEVTAPLLSPTPVAMHQ